MHEDNDILAVFSTEPYTHASPGKAGLHFMMAAATMLGFVAIAYQFYPDRPSAPMTFPSGLEAELGGKGALRVSAVCYMSDENMLTLFVGTSTWRRGRVIRCGERRLVNFSMNISIGAI